MEILGELTHTPNVNLRLVAITIWFRKLVQTIPKKTESTAEMAKHFFHNWIFNYGSPFDLIAESAKQSTAKCVGMFVQILTSKKFKKHPQNQKQSGGTMQPKHLYTTANNCSGSPTGVEYVFGRSYICLQLISTNREGRRFFIASLVKNPPPSATQTEHSEVQRTKKLKYKWKL